jgi:hypothetical protein
MLTETTSLQRIRLLSDGRAGHENQSVGLAAALARRTGASVETVHLRNGFPGNLRLAAATPNAAAAPQLLIGTGHRTHLPLLYAAARLRAASVVIMKPTLPTRLFDLCFIPAHDLKSTETPEHVIMTRGALNRIPEELPPKQATGLMLIGGPSKHHGWNADALIAAVRAILNARPELTWTIGDSRRTPQEFMAKLSTLGLKAKFVPHGNTTPEWLPSQLLAATEAWVTEDSISMIHEAVTAGARTGLLPAPILAPKARVLRSIQDLASARLVTPFAVWSNDGQNLPVAQPFHETARCADLVLEKLFPQRRL